MKNMDTVLNQMSVYADWDITEGHVKIVSLCQAVDMDIVMKLTNVNVRKAGRESIVKEVGTFIAKVFLHKTFRFQPFARRDVILIEVSVTCQENAGVT